MTLEILLQTLASGVLIGLIYALVAIGLTMIFGVMDIVNFAHGEFLMLGMYSAFWLFALFALDPLLTLPLTVLMLFAFGVLLYKLVISRITNAPMLSQIFATFGLMILLRGVAQFLWKPDFRSIENSAVSGSVKLFGSLQLGRPQLVAGLGAVLVTGVIWYFLNRTRMGAALEATASDKEAARLMGIDSHRMFALAWGIGAACAGAAGALLATFFPIFPDVGANFILLAFVVVNLGGFGSVTGAFWAGILVGVIEVMGGLLLGPQYKTAIVLALFLAVLMFRPQGLMGKA
ncbi:MAG TPA: branched-chain amino acid ABC transporter permease [Rhizobacter sp.]|nr:branched-chain amino acid ABC transporter permease [Rhizobacter sp.]